MNDHHCGPKCAPLPSRWTSSPVWVHHHDPEYAPFEWSVTFPDLPLETFRALGDWVESAESVRWGKWTARIDHRVSAAALHGQRFADLAAVVGIVEDWRTWCGSTVRIPPLTPRDARWPRLARLCRQAAGEVEVTVAWSIDGHGLDQGTTIKFVDGHYAAEVIPLLDPSTAAEVPF